MLYCFYVYCVLFLLVQDGYVCWRKNGSKSKVTGGTRLVRQLSQIGLSLIVWTPCKILLWWCAWSRRGFVGGFRLFMLSRCHVCGCMYIFFVDVYSLTLVSSRESHTLLTLLSSLCSLRYVIVTQNYKNLREGVLIMAWSFGHTDIKTLLHKSTLPVPEKCPCMCVHETWVWVCFVCVSVSNRPCLGLNKIHLNFCNDDRFFFNFIHLNFWNDVIPLCSFAQQVQSHNQSLIYVKI